MWICLYLTVNQTIIIAGSFRVYIQGILAWSFKYTSTLSSVLTSTAACTNKNTPKHTDLSIGLKLCTVKAKSNPQNNEAQSLFVGHFLWSLFPEPLQNIIWMLWLNRKWGLGKTTSDWTTPPMFPCQMPDLVGAKQLREKILWGEFTEPTHVQINV